MAAAGVQNFDVDAVVIGAGAVGLACAAALARLGQEVFVLEAEGTVGTGCSSRNSEVAHAGIYYPTGSLKHLACIEGRRRLYPYLEARGVAFKKCGKLIVATSAAEEGRLSEISASARENGVEGLQFLSGRSARDLEPALSCVAALLSPETGVFDSHGYMVALHAEIEDGGGRVVFSTPVERVEPLAHGGFHVRTGGRERARLTCRRLVNSAGLFAQAVASRVEGLSQDHIPPLRLAKGSYFGFAGRSPFSRLVYPAPVDGGLGVHITLDLSGRMRFGPDVEWLASNDPTQIDYRVDVCRADGFYEAVRKYWPGLPDRAITPDYAGCRPKISGPGEPASDFRIEGPDTHGIEGLVNLFGIESPGLTSSLALGERVAEIVERSC